MTRMAMKVTTVTLEGQRVRLEPVSLTHLDALAEGCAQPETWKYFPMQPLATREQMRAWIEARIAGAEKGTWFTFATIDRATGRAVGSTSYIDISPADWRLEIGSTWLHEAARRTGINTECKFLLLRHAFEVLGTNRVQLKTDARNVQSQAAIERIGAKKEGVLRAQFVMADGYLRDSVMYSIIKPEWPEAKARLERLMAR
jgi:RimJ/RimL family protein N-acetyltransferase